MARQNGLRRNRRRKVPGRVIAHAPVRQGLVAHPCIRDVPILVRALLRHSAFRLDDRRQRVTREHILKGTLKEVGRHFRAQLLLHLVRLPRLVVRQVGGGDAPARARVTELPLYHRAGDAVHPDKPFPDVTPLHDRSDAVLGHERYAELVLRQADVLREEARLGVPLQPSRRRAPQNGRVAEDRPGTRDEDDRFSIKEDGGYRKRVSRGRQLGREPRAGREHALAPLRDEAMPSPA